MNVLYNELDTYAADWLNNLAAAGHVPTGYVDRRSIVDLKPDDCAPTSHFFAGIGGWALALELAGWPAGRPVWTGSCPCQPFSVAGRHKGAEDERHLWPEWFRLIRAKRPPVIFGEQVASKDALAWLDGVQADLEGEDYAVRAFDLSAAGFGAPFRRQRLYWVAQSGGPGLDGHPGDVDDGDEPGRIEPRADRPVAAAGAPLPQPAGVDAVPELRGVAVFDPLSTRPRLPVSADRGVDAGPVHPWKQHDALPCRDGWRIVEPGSFPLAHGVSGRVGRLCAYGNAIVPFAAAEFVKAYMEGGLS
jgi:DNA (cytosine-5)-methyltransferase 1